MVVPWVGESVVPSTTPLLTGPSLGELEAGDSAVLCCAACLQGKCRPPIALCLFLPRVATAAHPLVLTKATRRTARVQSSSSTSS